MTSPMPQPSQSPSPSPGLNDFKGALNVGAPENDSNIESVRRAQIQQVSVNVQDLSKRLDGIARQYPAAAQDAEELKRGLTRLLVRIVGSSMAESQSPTGALG